MLKSGICTEERLAPLQKTMLSIEGNPQTPHTKIQKVPHYLRKVNEFSKYYSPRLISVGPIHHGSEEYLRLGEQYKLLWTAMYLKETKQVPADLCQKIVDNIDALIGLFNEDAIEKYKDRKDELVWMLFMDGCAVLQFMAKLNVWEPQKLRIKPDQQEHVVMDLHLLENQVPYKVLELLSSGEESLWSCMFNFVSQGILKRYRYIDSPKSIFRRHQTAVDDKVRNFHTLHCQIKSYWGEQHTKPNHLLDYVRHVLLIADRHDHLDSNKVRKDQNQNDQKEVKLPIDGKEILWPRYKNIRELRTAGVRVKTEPTLSWNNISFESKWFYGELTLPRFCVDDSTVYIFLNIVAYEKCPDFENKYEICSALAFLDSLVDEANDVKFLREAGVIQNLLGSDDEVVKLINLIGTELSSKGFYLGSMGYSEDIVNVKHEIEKHCRNQWKTWLAEACITHFSNPWSMVGFLAGVLVIGLTIFQTLFSSPFTFSTKN